MSNWHDPDDPAFSFYLDEFIYNDEEKKRRQQHDNFARRNENNNQWQRNERNIVDRDDDFDDDDPNEESGRGNQELNDNYDYENDDDEDYDPDENDSSGSCRPVNLTSSKPLVSSRSPTTGVAALPLFTAILNEKLDVVRNLLRKNPQWINAKDEKGLTPLHYAIAIGYYEFTDFLLSCGADVNVKNNVGYTPLDLAKAQGDTKVVNYHENVGATASPLFDAIWYGQLDIVHILLTNNPQWINAKDKCGKTPLRYTIEVNDAPIMLKLIKYRANINDKDGNGLSLRRDKQIEIVKYLIEFGADVNECLFNAIICCRVDDVRTILESGIDVNIKNENGSTPLHEIIAVYGNGYDIEIIKYIVAQGGDVNAKDKDGNTPFYLAALHCWIEPAKFLISQGADVHAKNINAKESSKRGYTPLHWAVCWYADGGEDGFLEMIKFLVSLGADANVRDNGGNTPLHIAIKDRWRDDASIELEEFLVSKGANVNIRNNEDKTPLDLAADTGNYKIVEFLRQHDDFHALHRAVKTGDIELVKQLVSKGHEIDAKDRYWHGMTPLHSAALEKNIEIVKFLISQGADVNAKDELDYTPLHFTANVDVAQCLITAGADFNAEENEYGCTPLELAAREGDMEMVQYLVSQGAIAKAKDYGIGAVAWSIVANFSKNYDIARFLISKGINVDAKVYYDTLIGKIGDGDYEHVESLFSLQVEEPDLLHNLHDIIKTNACRLLEEATICDIKMADLVLKYVDGYIYRAQVDEILNKDFSKEREKRKKEKKEKLEQFWKQRFPQTKEQ